MSSKFPATPYSVEGVPIDTKGGTKSKFPITLFNTDETPFEFSGGGEPAEYLKTIVDNGDGTYTITDKQGIETVIMTQGTAPINNFVLSSFISTTGTIPFTMPSQTRIDVTSAVYDAVTPFTDSLSQAGYSNLEYQVDGAPFTGFLRQDLAVDSISEVIYFPSILADYSIRINFELDSVAGSSFEIVGELVVGVDGEKVGTFRVTKDVDEVLNNTNISVNGIFRASDFGLVREEGIKIYATSSDEIIINKMDILISKH